MTEVRAAGRTALGFIFLSTLLSAASFSIVIPVLPELVRQFTGGDRGLAAEWMMLLASSWGITQFLFSSWLGRLSDRVGRRPVLLLSSLGLGIDFAFMAVAPSLGWFLVGRLISGATSANVPAARAYLADVVPESARASLFGKLAAALSVGFITGPALGGALSQYDLRLPFVVAGCVCLVNFVVGFAVLKESLPSASRSRSAHRQVLSTSVGSGGLTTKKGLRPLLGVSFLVSLANMLWGSVWVLFCGHRFGWTPTQMGLQMMAAGALGLGVQTWMVGPMVQHFGMTRTLRFGLAITAASLAYAALVPSGGWFLASMPVAALGLVLSPSLSALLSKRAGTDHQGHVQGQAQSLHGLASIVGPPLFGLTFAWSLGQSSARDLSGVAVLLAALLVLSALAVSAFVHERRS